MIPLPRSLKDLFLPRVRAVEEPSLVAPGLYHFQSEVGGAPIRYHLRVDQEGPAILIAAAAEAVLLSPVGAVAAKALLEGAPADAVIKVLPVQNAAEVVRDVQQVLEDFGRWDVRYPVFNLVDPSHFGRPWKFSAPLQADVVVGDEAVAKDAVDRLWAAGVPHVRFLVTPRTGNDAVVQAVEHAEDVGMIAGIRLRNSRWLDTTTLSKLAHAGLDYIVLRWGVDPSLHDRWFGAGDLDAFHAIVPKIFRSEITVAAEVPLVDASWQKFPDQIDALLKLDVSHVEVYAITERSASKRTKRVAVTHPAAPQAGGTPPTDAASTRQPRDRPEETQQLALSGFTAEELRQLASSIEDLADERHMQLTWLPPALCPSQRSIDEIIRATPRAGGDITVRIETNGSVIPPRGPEKSAGNLFEHDWHKIWNHPAFQIYHERVEQPERCRQCPNMAICASFCPADEQGWVHP